MSYDVKWIKIRNIPFSTPSQMKEISTFERKLVF